MPLLKDDESVALDLTRLTFRDRVRAGRVVPIVSDEVIFDLVLGGYQGFVEGYARHTHHPDGAEGGIVALVKRFKHQPRERPLSDEAVRFDYLNYAKNHIYRLARERRRGRFDAGRGRRRD